MHKGTYQETGKGIHKGRSKGMIRLRNGRREKKKSIRKQMTQKIKGKRR